MIETLPVTEGGRCVTVYDITPHVGFVTHDAYKTFYRDTVENIAAWLDGHPLRVA